MKKPKTILLKHLRHNNRAQIGLFFDYDEELIGLVKSLGSIWNNTHNCWYLPNNPGQVKKLFSAAKGKAWIEGSQFFNQQDYKQRASEPTRPVAIKKKLNEEQQKAVEWVKQLLQSKGYSESTQNTYCSMLETFFTWLGNKPLRDVTTDDAMAYNSRFIIKTHRSGTYQRQFINALKFFYGNFSGHKLEIAKLERVKKEKKLPEVLTQDEVQRLINSYANLKHKAMILLTYSCGLRRSEVLNLKWKDVDRGRMLLKVRLGKGKKDRLVVLPQKTLQMLEDYWRGYKTKEYVFEGQKGGKYSAESLSKVLKRGLKAAGIKRGASLHTLRHSYATHLHEQGVDIFVIQKLLGHSSSKTTEIYTHISKKSLQGVRNPIENMDI